MKKTVYVAHPLRGDVESNVAKATEICRIISTSDEIIPFSPIHAFGYLDTAGDQFCAMQHCFTLLSQCNEIWVFGEWWKSEGCKAEMSFATCRKIPIRFKAVSDGAVIDHETFELLGGRAS